MSPPAILHGDATSRSLGFLRIWVFGAWFADVAKDPIIDLAALPIESLQRVGVLRLVPVEALEWMVTPARLRAGTMLLLLGLALSAVGVRPYRPIAVLTCLLLTLYQGLILGFTYVGHATLAALAVAYVLAAFPAADALAPGRRAARGSRATAVLAMVTATFCFCATYSFVGARRLGAGGLGIFLDETILKYIARNSLGAGATAGRFGLASIESPWIASALVAGYPIITCFELLSPLCLFSRWFRWAWIAAMLSFHLLTWPLMQLLFVHNVLLILVLLMRVDRLLPGTPAASLRDDPPRC